MRALNMYVPEPEESIMSPRVGVVGRSKPPNVEIELRSSAKAVSVLNL